MELLALSQEKIAQLESKAKALRIETLKLSLETGLAHIGGCLSAIEIYLSLYDIILKENDKFILSKGHASLSYFLLLREKGYNPHISGHPDIDPKNGIHCTTGSLGHGLPIAIGMALAYKIKGKPGHFYVVMSDGEFEEGSTWEAMDLASTYNLDNITIIIDYNKIQALDFLDKVRPKFNLRKKIEAFNWDVIEVNGHSFAELIPAIEKKNSMPHAVIAHTIKGKGVSYIENDPAWHGKKPKPERLAQAFEELK